jgi:adenosylmethionine-8-amino-7-oxononanoate aminotransferase
MKGYAFPDGNVFYRKLGSARPKISHGQGIYLFDESGKRYIDGSGGALVVNVGHGRAEIIEAMNQQLQKAAYIHATMFTSDVIETYSRELAQIVPIDDPRFYYLSSGSEVVEGAIKLARQIQLARGQTDRNLIIGRHLSYHGMSFGALSVSGRPNLRNPYLGMMHDMPHIDPPYPYRNSSTGEEVAIQLEEEILRHGPERIAGFIAEPISGAGLGAIVPQSDYWPIIRQICDRYGVLLIVDEVMVGMGRTGRWWGIDHWEVSPDILVTSKGAASGYFPLGFIATGSQHVDLILQNLGDFNHGGTFSHHVVGAAAGLATLRILQKEELVANSARIGTLLGAKLRMNLNDHPHVGDIRGRGLFWAIELVKDRQTKEPFEVADRLALKIWKRAFDLGLVIYYSQGCANGRDGDLVMVGPPLVVDEDQVDEIAQILTEAITSTI